MTSAAWSRTLARRAVAALAERFAEPGGELPFPGHGIPGVVRQPGAGRVHRSQGIAVAAEDLLDLVDGGDEGARGRSPGGPR